MSTATISVRSWGLSTDLRSVTPLSEHQKRILSSDFLFFVLISCVTEEKYSNEINTLLVQAVLNACAQYL